VDHQLRHRSLYTVFAKIVDPATGSEKFSAFLVERDTPGLTVGAEEHKLGIRGSSTCPLVLDGCRIPVANLLGEAARATTSPSTCSMWAATSWASPASAARGSP